MFWRWFLIWAVLLLAAAAYLWYCGRGLWGQTKELGRELAEAQARLEEVQHELERLEERTGEYERVRLAIFRDPLQVLVEQRALRDRTRAERLARQRARRPAWARRALHEDDPVAGGEPAPAIHTDAGGEPLTEGSQQAHGAARPTEGPDEA